MIEFISAPENIPFSVALAVMFGMALLEGITAIFGAALSGLLETLIPDYDFEVDLSDIEAQSPSALSRLLGWLRIGEVPILMLLVVFLTSFGLIGLGIQSFSLGATGYLLPGIVASIPAFILALPVLRILGGLLGKILPKDETEAVSTASFIGRTAIITLGTSKAGSPSEAKVKDKYGVTHYIMVEPDIEGIEFKSGSVILLVKNEGHIFKAIKNRNENLVD